MCIICESQIIPLGGIEELKLDGVRLLLRKQEGQFLCWTRSGLLLNAEYLLDLLTNETREKLVTKIVRTIESFSIHSTLRNQSGVLVLYIFSLDEPS